MPSHLFGIFYIRKALIPRAFRVSDVCVVLGALFDCDVYHVTGLPSDFAPDVFEHPDDVAGRTHPNQAAVIRNAVKRGMNLDAPLAEFAPTVVGEFDIRAINVRHFFQFGTKGIGLFIHDFALR